VELTPFQGDHGVDLILARAGEKVIVQCKHRPRGSVGEPVLRDLFGALHHFNRTSRSTSTRCATWSPAKPPVFSAKEALTGRSNAG
jgi:hypothetical protein